MINSKKVILECSVCGAHNYRTNAKEQRTERLRIKKYCPKCDKHTIHEETR